jgi:tetratricopeptide (TPR) repeat protein
MRSKRAAPGHVIATTNAGFHLHEHTKSRAVWITLQRDSFTVHDRVNLIPSPISDRPRAGCAIGHLRCNHTRPAVETEGDRLARGDRHDRPLPFQCSIKLCPDRLDQCTPARHSALMSQARAELNNGDYDKAIATLSEAMRLDPKSALVFASRGFAYEKKRDYDRAIADHNEAIRLDPNYALASSNRGFAYLNKGDNDRAIADFNEAIRLDAKNANTFFGRGLAYANKGDYDQAIADYNEAIRLDANKDSVFASRGFAYEKKRDQHRAIADYNEAIRLNPKYALAFCNRGRVKLHMNDASGNADIAKARQLDASICR